MPDLSIVATMYRSAPYLPEFCRRATVAAADFADVEVVLVNDGSPDEAVDVALALRAADPRVVVVDLSRNFGHHKAMMTGLGHARGDLVFLLDCDLEESPEWLVPLEAERRRAGADVAYGRQAKRKGGLFERLSGAAFYRLLNALSPVPMPANVVTARVMSRRYVDALVRHRDREVFILGLWTIAGFAQVPVDVTKASKGQSTYSLARKLALLVDAVTSFSSRPLVYISCLGLGISAVSIAAACGLVAWRLTFGYFDPGWPSLIVSIWFLGGLTILSVGVIGLYVAKVFGEVKDRPYTVVRHVHGPGGDSEPRT